jgi:Na+-transporting NADH:ubiquinone oxidoreductase subunit NqrE
MKMTMKARTAFGLGGQEFYTETVEAPASNMERELIKRQFAIKYGVDLDRIEVIMEGTDCGQFTACQITKGVGV